MSPGRCCCGTGRPLRPARGAPGSGQLQDCDPVVQDDGLAGSVVRDGPPPISVAGAGGGFVQQREDTTECLLACGELMV